MDKIRMFENLAVIILMNYTFLCLFIVCNLLSHLLYQKTLRNEIITEFNVGLFFSLSYTSIEAWLLKWSLVPRPKNLLHPTSTIAQHNVKFWRCHSIQHWKLHSIFRFLYVVVKHIELLCLILQCKDMLYIHYKAMTEFNFAVYFTSKMKGERGKSPTLCTVSRYMWMKSCTYLYTYLCMFFFCIIAQANNVNGLFPQN